MRKEEEKEAGGRKMEEEFGTNLGLLRTIIQITGVEANVRVSRKTSCYTHMVLQ